MLFFVFLPATIIDSATLSLHDALPIYRGLDQLHETIRVRHCSAAFGERRRRQHDVGECRRLGWEDRSEEHTSELQSRGHLVCRPLLEKKNNIVKNEQKCKKIMKKVIPQ